MNFEEIVKNTNQISNYYCRGLTALGNNSSRIKPKNTSLIEGSVDIDSATKKYYPDKNRWDYVIGYNGKAYFVEVHPASSSNVKEVKAKFEWLKEWVSTNAPELLVKSNGLNSKSCFWICTNGCSILKISKQYRMAANIGLLPKREITLS